MLKPVIPVTACFDLLQPVTQAPSKQRNRLQVHVTPTLENELASFS
jgi:hypothetical protein